MGISLALSIILLAFLVTGCAGVQPSTPLAIWTLRVDGAPAREVTLPCHLDAWIPRNATYTLETDVEVAAADLGHELAVAFPEFKGMGSLSVNGEPAIRLDANALVDRHRSTRLLRFGIPGTHTRTSKLHLALKVSHVWGHTAWFGAAPVLMRNDVGLVDVVAIDAFNHTVGSAALATVSFIAIFTALLAWLTRERTFALLSLGAALNLVYPSMVLGSTQSIFGVYEVAFATILIVCAAVCAMHFGRAYFGLPAPSPRWFGWVAVCTVAALLGRDPFTAPRWIIPLAAMTTTANVALQLSLVLRFGKNRRPGNLFAISLAWPATALLAVPDFFLWSGRGGHFWGIETACVGMSIISMLQAVALFRDHALSMRRAARLNTELGSRVGELEKKQREIELLNDDLRRQIAARSRELAGSLVNAEHAPLVTRPSLTAGEIVEGRYTVLRTLGTGGMGAVYEVARVVDGAHFAMKILRGVTDPVAHARFAREAEIAANLKHANVVSVVDFDVTTEGHMFLVMDLVRGETLRDALERPHALEWQMEVLRQIAEGLDAIHSRGIVHRDLKPANVLLQQLPETSTPLAKITDFGVASLLVEERISQRLASSVEQPHEDVARAKKSEATVTYAVRRRVTDATVPAGNVKRHAEHAGADRRKEPSLTAPGTVVGTPFYMAPELAYEAAAPAADIFSFGVVAFQLLAGKRPFTDCPLRVLLRGGERQTPPSFSVVPMLAPELIELLDRALGSERAKRPSARELAGVLGSVAVIDPEPTAVLHIR